MSFLFRLDLLTGHEVAKFMERMRLHTSAATGFRGRRQRDHGLRDNRTTKRRNGEAGKRRACAGGHGEKVEGFGINVLTVSYGDFFGLAGSKQPDFRNLMHAAITFLSFIIRGCVTCITT